MTTATGNRKSRTKVKVTVRVGVSKVEQSVAFTVTLSV